MGAHQHESVRLPGGPTDDEGRDVDEAALGALVGAALQGSECVAGHLDEVAGDVSGLVRLVTFARLTTLRFHHGELPGYMTDDDDELAAYTPGFRRLVRAVTAGEPLFELCEQMTPAQRRSAAGDALDALTGHLSAMEGPTDPVTLAELCCRIGAVMIGWSSQAAPMAERDLTETWQKYQSGRHEAGLKGSGADAVALLLGAVLHQQARTDEVTTDTIQELVLTRALPVLKAPERAGEILRAFVAPPETEAVIAPVKRLARRDRAFLTDLCSHARHLLALHVENCPYGLRESSHECTLAHRLEAISGGSQTPVSTPAPGAPGEGRRVVLPRIGYHEDPPAEGAPESYPDDHLWHINVGRILLTRWDAGIARWNEKTSEDSSIIGTPAYDHETGLEQFACPACGKQESFLVEGRWGDPITLHCRCGVTTMSPADADPDDLGHRLLKRLILCDADPAYAARRLMPPLTELHESEHRRRSFRSYLGPDTDTVALVEAVDLEQDDLAQALAAVLRPRLPRRHGGNALTLTLLEITYALSAPVVRDSDDGRRLAETARAFLAGLKQESDRWAPSRQPVPDRLQLWRDEGGPQRWQDAWERTIEVAGRHFEQYQVRDGRLSNGCAALTLALYLLAREAETGVEQISRDEVLTLLEPGSADATDDAAAETARSWATRLQVLGHDLDADDDPVARMWQHLRPEVHVDSYSDKRQPALLVGLAAVLGPRSFHNIRF
ncbi:hypothetical protein [Streptomyces acidiscabies]|uniref:Uncharacterized protein n=1 Tax=Streptomyces acidiscabies TaxID=42234 RepID=A0ABU4MCR1_9ACTN|nr:hypothetical protein [Streptomyces acidiscabies]MDX3024997.1 hypothetical protein [Streptomyces acidiscabies]